MMISTSVMIFSPVMVKAGWVLIWEGDVNSASITPVVGPTLESGEIYLIVASEIFWLDPLTDQYYVADAMYYQGTPGGTDSWNWNPALVNPAPGGQSFLQIDGASVNWGPFSNGDTGHMYTYYYTGTGAPITFFVAELLGDRDDYSSHFIVKIYKTKTVGGYILGSNILKAVPSLAVCAFIAALLTTRRILKSR